MLCTRPACPHAPPCTHVHWCRTAVGARPPHPPASLPPADAQDLLPQGQACGGLHGVAAPLPCSNGRPYVSVSHTAWPTQHLCTLLGIMALAVPPRAQSREGLLACQCTARARPWSPGAACPRCWHGAGPPRTYHRAPCDLARLRHVHMWARCAVALLSRWAATAATAAALVHCTGCAASTWHSRQNVARADARSCAAGTASCTWLAARRRAKEHMRPSSTSTWDLPSRL